MKTIVISGSATLYDKMDKWHDYWESQGYSISAYPEPINEKDFPQAYPVIHQEFYIQLAKTDLHFIANEEKRGIVGYVGPGVFAEIAFRVGLNLTRNEHVPIVLLTEPTSQVCFYEDLKLWLSLGWIQLFDDFKKIIFI